MNASQRRLLVWSLVVAAVVAHFCCWSWGIGLKSSFSHPLVPFGTPPPEPPHYEERQALDPEIDRAMREAAVHSATLRRQLSDPHFARLADPEYAAIYAPIDYLGANARCGSPIVLGFWLPVLLLVAARFVYLGRSRSPAGIASHQAGTE